MSRLSCTPVSCFWTSGQRIKARGFSQSSLCAYFDAQVSLPVVRRFIKAVEEAAIGEGVVKGVEPGQQLVKVVNTELIKLMGGDKEGLVAPDQGPQVGNMRHRAPRGIHNLGFPCCFFPTSHRLFRAQGFSPGLFIRLHAMRVPFQRQEFQRFVCVAASSSGPDFHHVLAMPYM